MKISVIVPVYNVSAYLRTCIDSILNQTVADLQVILVDDGSKDNSGEICEEYKKRDSRVIVVHKTNGGLSSARNCGLKMASGKLIGFIDGDDWIEPDYYEVLLEGILAHNADISVMHMKNTLEKEKIEFATERTDEWVRFNSREAMESFFTNNFIGYSACNKLYRRELFDGIEYPKGMLMEDKATTYKLIHKSNWVAVNLSNKYHYRLRSDGIMQSSFNRRKFDSLLIHRQQIEFVDSSYPELYGLIRGRYAYEAFRLLLMMIRSNYSKKQDVQSCLKIINENIKFVLKEKRIGLHHKIYISLFYVFPHLVAVATKSKLCSKVLKNFNIA